MEQFFRELHPQGAINTELDTSANVSLCHVGISDQTTDPRMEDKDIIAEVLLCVEAKAAALLYACMRESRKLAFDGNIMWGPFWQTYQGLDTALSAFQKRLPALNEDGQFDLTIMIAHIRDPSWRAPLAQSTDAWFHLYGQGTTTNTAAHWHTFLFVQSCIYAGRIALHGMLANIFDNESTLVLITAGKMAELVKSFANNDTSGVAGSLDCGAKNTYMFTASAWGLALHVLRCELISPLRSSATDETRLKVAEHAEILTRALKKLKGFYVSLNIERFEGGGNWQL